MPTTITSVTPQGSIPASGPVINLPLPTTVVTNATVAPAPYLETGTENGIAFLRTTIPLHINTRRGDTIRTYFKNSSKSFIFCCDVVDENFENREIKDNKGRLITSFPIENIKNNGMPSGIYRFSYAQTNIAGKVVVASLNHNCEITVT